VVNLVYTSTSEEEASPLRCHRKRTNKSPLREASVVPPRVADAPVIKGLTSSSVVSICAPARATFCLLDAGNVPAPELTSVEERAKGLDDELVVGTPMSARLVSDAQTLLVRANSGPGAEAGGLIPKPRDFRVVGRGEVCSFLVGRLQDVSIRVCCVRCFAIWWLQF
jgi:hypothetical protein